MPTVDFMVGCYHRDAPKLHEPGMLKKLVDAHKYPFNRVIVVRQNCATIEHTLSQITDVPNLQIVRTEDHPNIIAEWGMSEDDPDAAACSSGKDSPHFWLKHVRNHLCAFKVSQADYQVCQDSDVLVIKNEPGSWVTVGIECFQKYQELFLISPGEGGKEFDRKVKEGRLTQTTSQQIFLCDLRKMKAANLNVYFDITALLEDKSKRTSNKLAPYQPFREYYQMAEGRFWRWMDSKGLYRLMLDDNKYKYWHYQSIDRIP